MPTGFPPPRPKPLLIIIEAYAGIRLVFPAFLDLYLAGAEPRIVKNIDEALRLLETPEARERVAAFITHGIAGPQKVAHDAVIMMDSLLGRPVPYVVLSAAHPSIDLDLPRPPVALIDKGARGSLPACLVPLRPHFGMKPVVSPA